MYIQPNRLVGFVLSVAMTSIASTACKQVFAQSELPVAMAGESYKQMLSQALSRNPSVQAAMGQIKVSGFEKQGARWQYFPTPSIGVEQSSLESKLSNNLTSFARLQQPIWTGGKLDAQLDRATAQEQIALSALEEQKLNLVLSWIALWGEVQGAEWRISAYRESEQQHINYVQKVSRRASEGQSAASDVQLSQFRLSSVQADLGQALLQKQLALGKLKRLLGNEWPAEIGFEVPEFQKDIVKWSDVSPMEWLDAAYRFHPSVRKANATEKLLAADLKATKSKAYPDVFIRAEITDGNVTGTNRLMYIGMTSSLGAGLSTFSNISAAQAKLDSAKDELEILKRNIADQIQADIETVVMQSRRTESIESTLYDSGKYLESSERQFTSGRKSWQELMNTARERSTTLVQLADAKTQIWVAMQRLTVQSRGVDAYLGVTSSVN
ncbi:hypothetical protein AEP_01670 [Curvibacter sp. AEP1-3]|uniref:TolC family protein n=1 Tax=Curvibacter sp. AEP1-3 TaxID=1844971 RepID=UPI000B3D459C|nr:TolC family protein [Curvibacter sp. AEP1-3]ARV18614.1 hypothetical protein AEP_01670 [Curvibacter sp. AEP1-3]